MTKITKQRTQERKKDRNINLESKPKNEYIYICITWKEKTEKER